MRFCSSIKFFIHVVATRWRIVSAKLLPIAVCALGLAAQDVSAQSADIPFEFEEISVTAERPAPSEPDAVDSQITTAFSKRQ